MQVLTNEFLGHIVVEIGGWAQYYDFTLGYLRSLLTPYAQALEPVADLASLEAWIPQALPGELAKHAVTEMNKALAKMPAEAIESEKARSAAAAVIEYLAAEVIELADSYAREHHENWVVLPWDIQAAVSADAELSQLLGVTTPGKLPVTVTFGSEFTHELSQDFWAGLMLYQSPSYANKTFKVSMFGAEVPTDILAGLDNSVTRYDCVNDLWSLHRLVLTDDSTLQFDSLDFLQGITTAASWLSDDYHAYKVKLFVYPSHDTAFDAGALTAF